MDQDPYELAAQFDLRALSAAFYADPYPTYRALRELAPVRELADDGIFLSRYADVVAVYKDPKTYSSDKTVEFFPKYGDSPLYQHHTTSLVFNDPPRHTRVRKLLIGALTAKAIAHMESPIGLLVDELLDRADDVGTIDLIEQFASAIPVEVIGNLLGVPRAERAPLRAWSLAILGALEPTLAPHQHTLGNTAVEEFTQYLTDLVARRRNAPGNPDVDVLTRLIEGEVDGERLSADELLHNCIFILNAGHETTTNLIGNALDTLAQWPQQRGLLSRQPELIGGAVEEVLRFESSNQLGNRVSTIAVMLGERRWPAGTRIHLGIGAANRDPAQFSLPEVFDITRTPNRHVAFGSGIHQCAGMALARLEATIAIGRFMQRFPDFCILPGKTHSGRARFRGFSVLPCAVNG